jgi:hypothetical protein
MGKQDVREWLGAMKQIGTGVVEWRGDYGLPRSWRTALESEDFPYVVELDFIASKEDGPSCRAIRMRAPENGEPISARRVREVPVAECIRAAIGLAAIPIRRSEGEVTFLMGGQREYARRFPEAFELARDITSDEHLREVAKVYMAATEKPTRAVEEAFRPISHSTAARWVGKARQRGFLPPARPAAGGSNA